MARPRVRRCGVLGSKWREGLYFARHRSTKVERTSPFLSRTRFMSASPPTDRPLRRDAERTRQRILEAAREAFAEGGLAVTLDEIAHRAGVGVGTVYRRFPDKEELIDALFEERMGELVALAETSLR